MAADLNPRQVPTSYGETTVPENAAKNAENTVIAAKMGVSFLINLPDSVEVESRMSNFYQV